MLWTIHKHVILERNFVLLTDQIKYNMKVQIFSIQNPKDKSKGKVMGVMILPTSKPLTKQQILHKQIHINIEEKVLDIYRFFISFMQIKLDIFLFVPEKFDHFALSQPENNN